MRTGAWWPCGPRRCWPREWGLAGRAWPGLLGKGRGWPDGLLGKGARTCRRGRAWRCRALLRRAALGWRGPACLHCGVTRAATQLPARTGLFTHACPPPPPARSAPPSQSFYPLCHPHDGYNHHLHHHHHHHQRHASASGHPSHAPSRPSSPSLPGTADPPAMASASGGSEAAHRVSRSGDAGCSTSSGAHAALHARAAGGGEGGGGGAAQASHEELRASQRSRRSSSRGSSCEIEILLGDGRDGRDGGGEAGSSGAGCGEAAKDGAASVASLWPSSARPRRAPAHAQASTSGCVARARGRGGAGWCEAGRMRRRARPRWGRPLLHCADGPPPGGMVPGACMARREA